jgi:hypothetical protein
MRPVDEARAALLLIAQLTGDREMWATTVQETLDDDYGFGQLGSLFNVLRKLSEDLAAAVCENVGDHDQAVVALRAIVAECAGR